jgi:hypothetical protein
MTTCEQVETLSAVCKVQPVIGDTVKIVDSDGYVVYDRCTVVNILPKDDLGIRRYKVRLNTKSRLGGTCHLHFNEGSIRTV